MRFGDLTFTEIRNRAEQGYLAVIPTGCTEQQGPHLPVDFDTWFVETLCLAAARHAFDKFGVNTLVLPAVPFGPTPEHINFGSGFIHIPQETHEAFLWAVLESLLAQGFQQLVIWRGCGGHRLEQMIDRLNKNHSGRACGYLPSLPYHDIWCKIADPSIPGGHADSFATSICMHLRPEAVRADLIVDPQNSPVNWADPELDFSEFSSTGVIGDPTQASAELGERLWQAAVRSVAKTLKSIADSKG